jgi:Ion channel
VPDIAALAGRIPDEFKPIAALCIGALILVCLVLFHGVCLHYVLMQHQRGVKRLLLGRPHLIAASFLFGWAVFLMLDLHIVEILTWATILTHTGLIVRAYDAIYFCANAYTTVGYGKVDVADQWRNITPIISISGLFTFAWTTSALVDVVSAHGRLLSQLEDEREHELKMRTALRTEEAVIQGKEKEAERSVREKLKTEDDASEFFRRYEVWREERKDLAELRHERSAEVRDLRTKERVEEEKLGPGKLPGTDDEE